MLAPVALSDGQVFTEPALGIVRPATVRGTVWDDTNKSGGQDGAEAGIDGMVVFEDLNGNGLLDQTVYGVTGPTGAIPAGQATTYPVTVNQPGPIAGLSVQLALNNPLLSNLTIVLISPAGTRVELLNHIPDTGQQNLNISLTDESAFSIADPNGIASICRPQGRLGAFDGEDPAGVWQLEITADAAELGGWLNYWSLQIKTGESDAGTGDGEAYVLSGIRPGAVTVRQAPLTDWKAVSPLSGSQSMTLQPGQTVVGMNFGDVRPFGTVQGTIWHDTNGEAIRQGGEPGLPRFFVFADNNTNGILDQATTNLSGPSQPIPDAGRARIPILYLGAASVAHVEVSLTINHPDLSELEAYLVSPTGRRVKLLDGLPNVGGTNLNIRLSDAGVLSVRQSFTSGGTARPVEALAAFDGENAQGTWYLEVADLQARPNKGSVTAWTLYVSTGEPDAVTDSDGLYTLHGVMAAPAKIRAMVPPNWTALSPLAGSYGVTLTEEQVLTGQDFVLARPCGTVTGVLWNDRNGDGVRQTGEEGIPALTVFADVDNNGTQAVNTSTYNESIGQILIPDGGVWIARSTSGTRPASSPTLTFAFRSIIRACQT